MIDIRYTHRETGISFEYEEGQDVVVIEVPPSEDRVTTLTSKQLRELATLLLEIADKAAVNVDDAYSARVDSSSTSSRAQRDEDLPF